MKKWHSREYIKCIQDALESGQHMAARAIAALALRAFQDDETKAAILELVPMAVAAKSIKCCSCTVPVAVPVDGFIQNMSRCDLETFATSCSASCSKKHFAAHGAITHISQAISWMDLSGGNPEGNSQLLWNYRFDDIRKALVHALNSLKEVT